jgi:hypothetical protein
LANEVALFASATGQPAFVHGNPPVWRVIAPVRLSESDPVTPLGVVEVNVLTGEVIPLTEQQRQTLQSGTDHVAAPLLHTATTTG